MRIVQWRKFDTANAPGISTTIFVSGCTHNCKGCFNSDYFDFNKGAQYNNEYRFEIEEHFKANNGVIKTLVILGGEPFQQQPEEMVDLIKLAKENGLDVWIFSGYTYDEILSNANRRKILENCDVLVDGKFDETQKIVVGQFRGSRNQRIIDIQESFDSGAIIELDQYYDSGMTRTAQ